MSSKPAPVALPSPLRNGWVYGGLAVLCFAVTPVATRAAVTGGINLFFVASSRAVGAALLAAPLLLLGEPLRSETILTALTAGATVVVGRQAAITQQRQTSVP